MVYMCRRQIYLFRNGLKYSMIIKFFLGIILNKWCYWENILRNDLLLGVKY